MRRIAPLSNGFMIASIIGLLVSVFYVIKVSPSWGMAFLIVFGVMFISSLISMKYGPVGKV